MHHLYIGIILYSVSASLHVLGTILLRGLKVNSLCSSTQRMTLLNLCVVEMFLAIVGVAMRTCVILKVDIMIIFYVEYTQLIFINSWYIFVMIFLTVDRFMAIHFNIHYSLKWSSHKTRLALCMIPSTSLLISSSILVYFKPWQNMMVWLDVFDFVFLYILPSFNFLFLLVATPTYMYLYHKIRQNWIGERRTIASLNNQQNPQSTVMSPKEIKRGFYTPTLLILTFILFWFIPDLVHTVSAYQGLSLLYPIGTILDALVLAILPFSEKIKRTIHRWRI